MSSVISLATTYVEHTCGNCGVQFAFTEAFYNARRSDKKGWHCPNGCVRYFTGESDAQRERRAREAAERRETSLRAMLDQERESLKHLERRHAAAKGVATRIRNRVKHGVCPCCSETFKELRDHMKAAHPDFVPTAVD